MRNKHFSLSLSPSLSLTYTHTLSRSMWAKTSFTCAYTMYIHDTCAYLHVHVRRFEVRGRSGKIDSDSELFSHASSQCELHSRATQRFLHARAISVEEVCIYARICMCSFCMQEPYQLRRCVYMPVYVCVCVCVFCMQCNSHVS